jgi:DNA mismatch endonuclease (patch repair protein)
MADVVDQMTRSRMMAGIRGKGTKAEVGLRRALHALGFRFRINVPRLPGKPDIVLPRWNAAIFVHGCFWHRHTGCRYCTTPGTRSDFWQAKFRGNVQRDIRNLSELERAGWRIAVVWECAIKEKGISGTAEEVAKWITSTDRYLTIPEDSGRAITAPAVP